MHREWEPPGRIAPGGCGVLVGRRDAPCLAVSDTKVTEGKAVQQKAPENQVERHSSRKDSALIGSMPHPDTREESLRDPRDISLLRNLLVHQ